MNRFPNRPELSRSDEPPEREGVFWVLCPKGAEKHKFLVYSPAIQGVNQHWIPKIKRTVPCFTNHELCPGGHSEKNLKWRAYVFGFSYARHQNCFIQLTMDAWVSWKQQLKPGVSLRGQTINVCRTEKDKGRLWVEVEHWNETPSKKLANNEDVQASLYALWHFEPSGLEAKAKLFGDDFQPVNGSHVLA